MVLNRKIFKKDLTLILRWCKKNIGRSEYANNKTIKCEFFRRTDFMGEYDREKNIILIHPERNTFIHDLIKTIIHEYQHFRQDLEYYDSLVPEWESRCPSREKEFNKKFKDWYYSHPLENEAESIAMKFYLKCYKDIYQ